MPCNHGGSLERKGLYRSQGHWGDATLADYWRMAVLCTPEKVAVVDSHDKVYTYAQIDDEASRLACFLAATGVGPGDVVSFQLPGWAEFFPIYVACLKVGAVANPVLPNYRLCEVAYILNKCRSKVVFLPACFRRYKFTRMIDALRARVPTLNEVVVVEKGQRCDDGFMTLSDVLRDYAPLQVEGRCSADDLAAILFTSGTESRPKGVMLSHNNLIASEKAFNAAFHVSYLDVMLMPAPLAHATGFLHSVISPFMACAQTVLQDVFCPDECVGLIEKHRCTYMMGATPFLQGVLDAMDGSKADVSSLRLFLCGGAPVPRKMAERSLYAGIKLISVYGATESAPHTATRLYDPIEKIIHTDGLPLPGIEVKVVDDMRHEVQKGVEGEEVSRGPNVFMGYLDEPELTRDALDEDGWYYSGDLCTMDEDGYIRITGRKKDVIIRGGENISSKEIEELLLQHPKVREVAVVAMPDERLGQKACAYVVPVDKGDPISFAEMVEFFDGLCVAKFKYPERLEVVDGLQKTPSGKVQKSLLRQDVAAKVMGVKRGE